MPMDESEARPVTTLTDRVCRAYVPHKWLFIAGNVLLHVINISQGAPWWALWPLLIWGVLFSVHFFFYKSVTVDEEWADERIDELRWKSYDLGHVEDLEDRIRGDDFSTRPAHRRDPDWWQQPSATDASAEETSNRSNEDDRPSN